MLTVTELKQITAMINVFSPQSEFRHIKPGLLETLATFTKEDTHVNYGGIGGHLAFRPPEHNVLNYNATLIEETKE